MQNLQPNKFSLAVVAYRRPEYLAQSLAAIRHMHGLDELEHVIISVDDAPGLGAGCVQLADSWIRTLPISFGTVIQQRTRRGIVGNSVLALKTAFDMGAQNVIYVEDDAVLSPDALRVCAWMVRQDPGRYLIYGLSRGTRGSDSSQDLFSEQNVHPCPYAWMVRREEWPWILHHWCRKTYSPVGWSFAMTYNARMQGKARFLAPHLSRVRYIGRDNGTNGGVPEYEELARLPSSDGSYSGPYGVVDLVSDEKAREVDTWMVSEIEHAQHLLTDGWLGFGRPEELGPE